MEGMELRTESMGMPPGSQNFKTGSAELCVCCFMLGQFWDPYAYSLLWVSDEGLAL